MKYTIEWSENKTTTTGKNKMSATLKSETNETTNDVSIWEDFPGFANLKTGSSVEGDLVPAKDPKYGPTLYPPRVASKPPMRSAGAITKAQERKEIGIEKAQDNKEHGIKVSSTMRDAVLIVTTFYPKDTPDNLLKNAIELWRKWLWENWDKEEKDFDPFPSR